MRVSFQPSLFSLTVRRVLLAGAFVLMGSAASWPAWAAERRDLRAVEDELNRQKAERQRLEREATSAQSDLKDISEKMVAAARRVQDQEEILSALEARLGSLKREETALRDALARRDEQSMRVLTATQRLALHPTETLLARPNSPAETVRVAILLRQAIPYIKENADTLSSQLTALHHIDTAIRAQRAQMKSTSDKIRSEHVSLNKLVQSKQIAAQELRKQSKDVDERMDRLTREAQDMRDLLTRLEEEKALRLQEDARRLQARQEKEEADRQAALAAAKATGTPTTVAAVQPPPPAAVSNPPASFEGTLGQMPYPARGKLLASYGERAPSGETLKGLRIETRFEAQVVSLHDGVAVFAGPFKGYGNLLIIDHGEGYHALLAGLGRIDVRVGQNLTAGEPVGMMPSMTGNQTQPVLYMELRRKGQPINPLPWLSASKGNGRG